MPQKQHTKRWRRKTTRYRWGYQKENELRKILLRYFKAVARSASSHGLIDVWAAGNRAWLFQCKRTDGFWSQRRISALLLALERDIPGKEIFKFVAIWQQRSWHFYSLNIEDA